jgi:superfamily I DNA/RNA helicase
VKFYERAEVRDVLAYCKALANPADDLSSSASSMSAARDRQGDHRPGGTVGGGARDSMMEALRESGAGWVGRGRTLPRVP